MLAALRAASWGVAADTVIFQDTSKCCSGSASGGVRSTSVMVASWVWWCGDTSLTCRNGRLTSPGLGMVGIVPFPQPLGHNGELEHPPFPFHAHLPGDGRVDPGGDLLRGPFPRGQALGAGRPRGPVTEGVCL